MLARVPRTGNAYILSGKLYNRATKRHVVKYLDSRVQANAIARFINDACDTYDESSEVTKRFKTKYYTNVGFKTVINPNPHPVFGTYMEVFALYDIPAYTELFARYGEDYWGKNMPPSGSKPAVISTLAEYDRAMKTYSQAVKGLLH